MKKIFAISLLIFGPAIAAYSIDFKTREQYGAERQYAARTSAISTHVVTGYGMSYSIEAVGGTADFVVRHSTWLGGDIEVNRSSTVYALDGEPLSNRFAGIIVNPNILITRIDAATTIYVDIQYLAPRGGGAQ